MKMIPLMKMWLKIISASFLIICSATKSKTLGLTLLPFSDRSLDFIMNNLPEGRTIEIEDIKRTFCFDKKLGDRYDNLILNRLHKLFDDLSPYLRYFVMKELISYFNDESVVKDYYEVARDYNRIMKGYVIEFNGDEDELTKMKVNIFFLEYTCLSTCRCFKILDKFTIKYINELDDNNTNCIKINYRYYGKLLRFIPEYKKKIIELSNYFTVDLSQSGHYEVFDNCLSNFSKNYMLDLILKLKKSIKQSERNEKRKKD